MTPTRHSRLPDYPYGQNHLLQVRPVILAVVMLTQRLPASALEVQAGGIHEHQVKPREQVAAMREQPLFHHVLAAAWRKRGAAGAPCLFSSPGGI